MNVETLDGFATIPPRYPITHAGQSNGFTLLYVA